MSEIYKHDTFQHRSHEGSKRPKIMAVALAAAALAAVGIKSVERNTPPQTPAINGPHKEYVIQQGDTVSGILSEAYPDRDWRAITGVVEDQLPPEDRENHIVRPGHVLSLGVDAEIGQIIDNPAESDSAAKG